MWEVGGDRYGVDMRGVEKGVMRGVEKGVMRGGGRGSIWG